MQKIYEHFYMKIDSAIISNLELISNLKLKHSDIQSAAIFIHNAEKALETIANRPTTKKGLKKYSRMY